MLLPFLGGAGITAVVSLIARGISCPTWERSSYQGTRVSLTGGLAVAAGTVASAAVAREQRIPALIAVGSGAVAGYIDDHLEESFPSKGKGFRGHLGALREGKLTSGLLKIGLIGAGGLVAGSMAAPRNSPTSWMMHTGLNTIVIAGSANLINLLDLRPGRALKTSLIGGVTGALAGGPLGAGVAGASLAGLPTDLEGETMLGDLGANAVGAALGMVLASRGNVVLRGIEAAGIVALTLASERVSFSQVIEQTSFLKFIDDLGRH